MTTSGDVLALAELLAEGQIDLKEALNLATLAKEAKPMHKDADRLIKLLEICILGQSRFVNHYQILGVDPNASKLCIRRAYQEIQFVVHPDMVSQMKSVANDASLIVSNSYSLLMDNARRAAFDLEYSIQQLISASDRPSTSDDRTETPSGPVGAKKYGPDDYGVYQTSQNTYGARVISREDRPSEGFRPLFIPPKKMTTSGDVLALAELLAEGQIDLKEALNLATLAKEAKPMHKDADRLIKLLEICILGQSRFVNHYQILGVDPNASKLCIRRAYQEIQFVVHPDMVSQMKSVANDASLIVSNSYSLLMDNARRAAFDLEYSIQQLISASDRPSTSDDRTETPSGPVGAKKYGPDDYGVYQTSQNTYGARVISREDRPSEGFRPLFIPPKKMTTSGDVLALAELLAEGQIDLKEALNLATLAKEAKPMHKDADRLIKLLEICILGQSRFVNHYQILGVDPNASKLCIRRAYQEIQFVVHPDMVSQMKSVANDASLIVSNSYSLLMDNTRRAAFDLEYSIQQLISASDRPSTSDDRTETPSGPVGAKKYGPDDYGVYQTSQNTYGARVISREDRPSEGFRPLFIPPKK